MKFKHRMDWNQGRIDVGGTYYEIKDGYFTIDDPNPETVERLKIAGHEPTNEPKKPESKPSVTPLTKEDLTAVDGIGASYAQAIIDIFGTVENMETAGAAKIAEKIKGVDEDKAEEVLATLSI